MFSRRLFSVTVLLCYFSIGICAHHNYVKYGDIGQVAIPVVAGAISIAKQDWEGSKQAAIGMAATFAVVHTTKFIVNTKRPHGGKKSFPSGHTAISFAGAAFLHRRYGLLYGIPMYVAAGLVGHSRIVANAHWPVDVVGGALIALGITYLAVKPAKKLELMVLPSVEDGVSINAIYKIA